MIHSVYPTKIRHWFLITIASAQIAYIMMCLVTMRGHMVIADFYEFWGM